MSASIVGGIQQTPTHTQKVGMGSDLRFYTLTHNWDAARTLERRSWFQHALRQGPRAAAQRGQKWASLCVEEDGGVVGWKSANPDPANDLL